MLPAARAYWPWPHEDSGVHAGWFVAFWKSTPSVHLAHTRSAVAVAAVATRCPAMHARQAAHSRSVTAVGADTSNCVVVQTVVVKHVRSAVAFGATPWYWTGRLHAPQPWHAKIWCAVSGRNVFVGQGWQTLPLRV